MSLATEAHVITSDAEAIAVAHELADAWRPGAADRDRERRVPREELAQLGASGLLGITVPRAYGGADVSMVTLAEVFRVLASGDPAVGQVPQNHFVFVGVLIADGTPEQQAFFFDQILRGARLGNALSERGGRTARDWVTRLRRAADGTLRLAYESGTERIETIGLYLDESGALKPAGEGMILGGDGYFDIRD